MLGSMCCEEARGVVLCPTWLRPSTVYDDIFLPKFVTQFLLHCIHVPQRNIRQTHVYIYIYIYICMACYIVLLDMRECVQCTHARTCVRCMQCSRHIFKLLKAQSTKFKVQSSKFEIRSPKFKAQSSAKRAHPRNTFQTFLNNFSDLPE